MLYEFYQKYLNKFFNINQDI